ncbi:O-antigen ligase family protein [Prosthecobacter sp. SYSU 5D2]|uniref:O-antigen ligase family protein n=1 Tax=Prosthecobacter sp. SYSU 5D2 TaxID=3134134 RepID=UPI0031FE975B
MEYRAALIFLFLYYIRPQDWVPAISGANVIRPMMLIWLVSILSARSRPVVTGILRTPHDWAILAYYAYIVWHAPDFSGTLKGFLPFVVFYVFTVKSLISWERLQGYLKFWNFMLMGVAAMAVASLHGVDMTGAKDATEKMFGRLCIGTWLHDNPNALAHSVIVVLPLSYIFYFWKRGVIGRMIIFPACVTLACYCVYATESKGSFLVGGVLLVMIFVVGRPKPVQILALTMAATMGVSALSFLPRMQQMGNLRGDAGVQGRLMVWEMAKRTAEEKSTGVGWKQFQGFIIWDGQMENKATHSSYVQIGGDLGPYGMFFYLLPLWLALRSLLMSAKLTREDPRMERCRRAIMILIIAYMVSGWMINREYHTEYFLLIAAAAALHRLTLAQELETAALLNETQTKAVEGQMVLANEAPPTGVLPVFEALHQKGKRLWNRITVVDVGIGVTMTWAVMSAWDYILKNL